MSDPSSLESAYNAVLKEYQIHAGDRIMDKLRKELSQNKITATMSAKYIVGLEQLVNDLRKRIGELEDTLREVHITNTPDGSSASKTNTHP